MKLKEELRSIPDDIDEMVGYSESEQMWYWGRKGRIPLWWFNSREEAVADYLQIVKMVAS